MKARLCVMAAALLASVASASADQWFTKTDEDVFTGKQTAVMFAGDPGGPKASLYFSCNADHEVTLAYIFPSTDGGGNSGVSGNIVIRADGNGPMWFDAVSYDHNEKYVGFKSKLDDRALSTLTEIANAKKKVLAGLSIPNSDVKDSISIAALGSRSATSQFMKACDVKDRTEGGKYPKLP